MMALGLLCFWAPGFPNPGYRPSTSLPLLAREQQLIILVQAARSPRVSTMSRWSTSPSSTGTSQDPHSRSEEHTSELQSQSNLVCRLLLEKKKKNMTSSVMSQQHSQERV